MAGFTCLSDKQWQLIEQLMDHTFPPERGTPQSDLRKVWNPHSAPLSARGIKI